MINFATYKLTGIVDSNSTGKIKSGNTKSVGGFSDVLNDKLQEQLLQSTAPKMPEHLNMTGGTDGKNPSFLGVNFNTFTTTEFGDMSGVQLILFLMILMMQSSDSASNGAFNDMTPIIQMLSGILSQNNNDDVASTTLSPNNMPMFTDMDEESPVHIRRMVDIALEQVGYRERNSDGSFGNGNVTKFGAWYGMDGQPWCAMFVSWAADQAGMLDNTVPKHASTSRGVTAYRERGLYAARQSGYLPREGDTIFFQSAKGAIKHVGIVVGFDPQTQRVYTVEGNTDNAVRLRHYNYNSASIHGYGRNGGTGFGRIPSSSTDGIEANVT